MGLIDDRLHLFQTILLRSGGIRLGQYPAGTAKLDDFRAIFVQLAHHGSKFLRPIGDVDGRRGDGGRKLRVIAMPTGRAYRVGRRHDARTRYVALLDTLLEGDIIKPIRAHVTNCRKARFQRALGICHADDRPEIVSERIAVVAAKSWINREMDMHVDQSGKQSHSRQVDMARAGRNGPILDGHCRDAAIRNGDLWSRDHAAGENVHHSIGGDHHRIRQAGVRQKHDRGRQHNSPQSSHQVSLPMSGQPRPLRDR